MVLKKDETQHFIHTCFGRWQYSTVDGSAGLALELDIPKFESHFLLQAVGL